MWATTAKINATHDRDLAASHARKVEVGGLVSPVSHVGGACAALSGFEKLLPADPLLPPQAGCE